jgi:uncharacterized membrane protein YdbT with pleckstrin-like domain
METGIERAIEDEHPKRHDPGSPNATSESLEKLPFRLQHGETIIRELKPRFIGFMLTKALGSYTAVFGLIVAIAVVLLAFRTSLAGFLLELTVLPLALALLILAISIKPLVQYGKSWYWITNHRVIGKKGFLGYSINSVPLENVADVVITRTLLDRLLGLSSLIVVSMGNAAVQGSDTEDQKSESPNFFPALTQETARELQRVLFNLRDDLKAKGGADQATAVAHAIEQTAPAGKGATQASIQPRRKSSARVETKG